MNNRYYHLLSPVKIGNVILKNRMISSNAMPHFLQGPEAHPTNALISYYAGLARNGAAMVTFTERVKSRPGEFSPPDMARMPFFDISDLSLHNYFSQLADAVHFYNTKLSIALVPMLPWGYGASDRPEMSPAEREQSPETKDAPPFSGMGALKEAPIEMIRETIEDCAQRCLLYKRCGFDAVTFHSSYRGSSAGQFLSPLCNRRTDAYGGSVENRARFLLELAKRIKELCGRDFIIEAQVTAEEEGGTTLDDTIAFAHLAQGLIDIFQLRTNQGMTAHPTGYNCKPHMHFTLDYAEAVKKSGAAVLTAPIGGFQDPDELETYIRDGKCDMVAMGRAFICDPEYAKKLYENRGEDVVPCLLCNKCHECEGRNEVFVSMCSVNPYVGIAHRADELIQPVTRTKRVAVIGGGPAGMKAAIELRKRGHQVVLFEKSDALGGQLKHADAVSFKWPLARFKNYLIAQTYKSGTEVRLCTAAAPERITAEGFDALIFAAGAVPKDLNIPKADGAQVLLAPEVYGKEAALGTNVVVIGGSSTGAETGMHLAELGHNVTVLTRQSVLAEDCQIVHYYDTMQAAWEALPSFSWIPQAAAKEILANGVVYADAAGNLHTIPADSVVISGGVMPLQDEALKFYGCTPWFTVIGDCSTPGNVHQCMRTALAAASQI